MPAGGRLAQALGASAVIHERNHIQPSERLLMKLLQQIWQDFRRGENIDLYLTVFVSIVVTILNITGIAPTSWITPLNLAVLALLSIAILGNRYRIEEVLERINARGERLLVKFPEDQTRDIESE